jgi:hypothetical protein
MEWSEIHVPRPPLPSASMPGGFHPALKIRLVAAAPELPQKGNASFSESFDEQQPRAGHPSKAIPRPG